MSDPGHSEKMSIVSRCPECQGKGKVPKEVPFLANPKAPSTHAGRTGLKPCPRCQGRGVIGIGTTRIPS